MPKSRFFVVGFLALVLFDTFSQVCFKFTALHAAPLSPDRAWLMRVLLEPWLYGAILGYLGSFVSWMTLLRHLSVGPAFAASHLEVVGVILISASLFGEALTARQLLGAAIIVAGVACLSISEAQEERDAVSA